MPLNNLELSLAKLEKVIQENLRSNDIKLATINEREISSLLDNLKEFFKQERLAFKKYLPEMATLIRDLPLAIAILDRDMNYLAISDRWRKDYQLEEADLIGRHHYDLFPELSRQWRTNCERCLQGEKRAWSHEDVWAREDGSNDWLRWQLDSWHNSKGEIGGLIIFSETITEQKLLQQKIESTEEQMRAVFASMNELVFTLELDSESISILPTKFFELYDDAIVDRIIAEVQTQLFDSPQESRSVRALNRQVLHSQTTVDFEYSLRLDNSLIWFSVNVSPITDTAVIWIARDVTNRKETEEEVHYTEKELAQITLQSIGDAVITTDANGLVQYLNPNAEFMTGWSSNEAKNKPFSEIFQAIDEYTKKLIINPLNKVFRSHKVSKLNTKISLLARSGIQHEIEGLASPIMNRQQKLMGTVTVFRDVTKARKMARRLSWQASHDPLTKLYNWRKFEEYAARAINNAHLHQTHHALCYLDLDRFKIVNDSCGHLAGDRLLRQISSLLQKRIRKSDVFARFGGDEFGIIFHQCSIELALKCANELRKSIEEFRFIWQEKVFRIGVSIGLVEIKATTEKLSSLLNSADAACYFAKQQGGNYVHLCHEQDFLVAKQQGERQWIERINFALEEDHFCLYAQKIASIPKLLAADDLSINDRSHCEILLRLKDESGKVILPGAFLPAAERYGLMPTIDRWIIEHFLAGYESYCQSLSQSDLNLTDRLFTINLSGASINNQEFGNFLRSQFDRYSIPPETICFEITETVAITNLERANELIDRLRSIGCSIALDDFGSGMSSLTYLKNLHIDYLKIDGSFVTNIAHDEINYAAVECFNHISKIMKIETIAEFVEDQTTLEHLSQIGVDYAQGYAIERPKPLLWK